MHDITTEQQALLGLLAQSLFGAPKQALQSIDYDKLLSESKLQTVSALVFNNNTELAEKTNKKTVFARVLFNTQIFSNHKLVHDILTNAGVPYTVLKGAASAFYYPDPLLRTMGDVDFYVKKQDVARASAVLEQHGFTRWNQDHVCHVVFKKDKIHLEMHFEPAGVPNGKAGEIVRGYISDIIEASTLEKSELCTFVNPSRFHHGLIMLLHMQHHLLSEGIGLRHLCDWAVFVNSFEDGEFEKTFKDRLAAAGLWEFARIISLTAHISIALPYRSFMGDDKELAKSLLLDIVSGGNFGAKDEDRTGEGMFISNRGKNGIGRPRAVQILLSFNEIIYSQWPLTKKLKILLPFCWAFFGIRRIIREMTGKRKKTNIKKLYTNSKSRKELYKQLHLFELEEKK